MIVQDGGAKRVEGAGLFGNVSFRVGWQHTMRHGSEKEKDQRRGLLHKEPSVKEETKDQASHSGQINTGRGTIQSPRTSDGEFSGGDLPQTRSRVGMREGGRHHVAEPERGSERRETRKAHAHARRREPDMPQKSTKSRCLRSPRPPLGCVSAHGIG